MCGQVLRAGLLPLQRMEGTDYVQCLWRWHPAPQKSTVNKNTPKKVVELEATGNTRIYISLYPVVLKFASSTCCIEHSCVRSMERHNFNTAIRCQERPKDRKRHLVNRLPTLAQCFSSTISSAISAEKKHLRLCVWGRGGEKRYTSLSYKEQFHS